MKQLKRIPVLTGLCAGLGLVCLLLRQWLLSTGLDEKGLLLPGQPAATMVWALTAVACAMLIWVFFTWQKYTTCLFPGTALNAVATLFLILGYTLVIWRLLRQPMSLLALVTCALGAVSVLCMALVAWGQFRGQRMHPLLYCSNVFFQLVYLLLQYPLWSREAQPQEHLFQTVACAGMLITVFCRAELAAGKIPGRNYTAFSRGTLFFSIAAVAHCDQPLLYLCFALYILLDGCYLHYKQPKTEQPREQGE